MINGKVKFYDGTKGFGFIVDNETGKEYFVHATGLVNDIQKDDDVEFDLVDGKRGLNAINVKVR